MKNKLLLLPALLLAALLQGCIAFPPLVQVEHICLIECEPIGAGPGAQRRQPLTLALGGQFGEVNRDPDDQAADDDQ